ncbi:MAG TPA: nitroreductase family protein [Candidatus Bathyarchaeia archaeon]|nr:nitroreductase family protein [Candidatus Bathyarchaeia archaeon]
MNEKSFFDLVKKRRSIRTFKTEKANESKLNKILLACNMAPSAGGLQSFEIYQVKNKEIKKKLVSAARDQVFISEAPLLLVFCANQKRSIEQYGERSILFSVQDATIAAVYAQLATQALGLSSVWIGAFDENKVSEILHLPEGQRPISMLPIGYPNEKPKAKSTREISDILHVID